MDKTTPLLIMGTLLVVLILLVVLYVWIGRSKKKIIPETIVPVTFESLQAVIHHSSSTNSDLNHAVTLIIKRFIDVGSGNREFETYASLLKKLCTHPNTDSKIILQFEKALRAANPRYKEEVEKALKLGLQLRDKR
ncbi:MAG: hypothetical protein WCW84_00665 [Sulfurimonas sp.]|jgi:hypothetical protein